MSVTAWTSVRTLIEGSKRRSQRIRRLWVSPHQSEPLPAGDLTRTPVLRSCCAETAPPMPTRRSEAGRQRSTSPSPAGFVIGAASCDSSRPDHNDARATPFETSPFAGIGETTPIVDAITSGHREPHGTLSTTAHQVTNRRSSVEGSPAVWDTCVASWNDRDHTGPEAACLLTDTLVDGRSWLRHCLMRPVGEPRPHAALHDRTDDTSAHPSVHGSVGPARHRDNRHRGPSRRQHSASPPRSCSTISNPS